MYTVKVYSEELKSFANENIENVLKKCFEVNTNLHYLFNGNGGYSIYFNDVKQSLTYEYLHEIEEKIVQEKLDKAITLIKNIAKELNLKTDLNRKEEFTMQYNNLWVTLSNDNVKFAIRTQYNIKNKIIVCLESFARDKNNNYVEYMSYNETSPKFTFSQDREAKVIAKSIEKKFYPVYFEHKRRYSEALEKINGGIDETEQTMLKIKGEALTDSEKRDKKLYINNERVTIYRSSVYFEHISTSPEKAIKILEILKEV